MASESSFKPWKVALAAAGVVAVGAAWWFVKSEYQADKKKSKGSKKSKKADKSEAKQSASSAKDAQAAAAARFRAAISRGDDEEVNLPSEEELTTALTESLENLQTKAEVDGENEVKLLKWFKKLNPDDYSTRTRVLSAQWLVLFHTIKSITAASQDEYKASSDQQSTDMLTAWNLLDCEAQDDEQKAVDLLRLDVAQRLKDYSKMAPVFDSVLARGADMSYEEIVVAFTTAPLLGRWKATRDLGDRILQVQDSLEDFHRAALQRPDIPDYEVLYQLAEKEMANGDAQPDSLRWQVSELKTLSIRLLDVKCTDESKMETVRRAFDPESKGQWKEIPTRAHRLLQFGGIAQMLSLSAIPIPMVGPANNERIHVLGYAVLNPQDGSGPVRQTESYELSRDAPNTNDWHGTYTLTQEGQSANSQHTRVEIIFDMKMTLQTVDE